MIAVAVWLPAYATVTYKKYMPAAIFSWLLLSACPCHYLSSLPPLPSPSSSSPAPEEVPIKDHHCAGPGWARARIQYNRCTGALRRRHCIVLTYIPSFSLPSQLLSPRQGIVVCVGHFIWSYSRVSIYLWKQTSLSERIYIHYLSGCQEACKLNTKVLYSVYLLQYSTRYQVNQVIPTDTNWYQLIPSDTNWYQLIPTDTKLTSLIPKWPAVGGTLEVGSCVGFSI